MKFKTCPAVQAKYSGKFAGMFTDAEFAVTTAVLSMVAQIGNVEVTRIWYV